MTLSTRLFSLSGTALLLCCSLGLSSPQLPAQQGGYSLFGAGCGPTTAISGSTNNMTCRSPAGARTNGKNYYAISCREKVTKTLSSVTFRMQGTRPTSMLLELWLADKTGRPSKRLRTGSMVVGRTYGSYTGRFTPYRMAAGQNYAIVIFGARDIVLPQCKTGNLVAGYTRVVPGTWKVSVARWAYRVNAGSVTKVPTLRNSAVPLIGRAMSIQLANARPNTISWLNFGDSATRWGPLSLPLHLSAFQASGCYLRTSQLFSVVLPTNSLGRSSLSIPVPNHTSLIGKRFYNQGMIYDKTANRLGFSFTNAGSGLVGKPCGNSASRTAGGTLRFALPRVNFFGFPGLSIAGNYTGTKRKVCCTSNGPQACYYSGRGTITGQVGQFSIPVTALGKVVDDINAKVCTLLKASSSGTITCSSLMGISVNGIKVNAGVNLLRNDCNRTNSYSSRGSIQFPGGVFGGVDTTASVKLPIIGKFGWKFKLGVTATPAGSWVVSANRAWMTIKITSVSVTGTTTIPVLNKKVNFNFKISTPSLTFTTPAVRMPTITIGC